MRLHFLVFPCLILGLVSCVSDEHSDISSATAPAAYIPPPEDVPPPPSDGSTKWIGPNGYAR